MHQNLLYTKAKPLSFLDLDVIGSQSKIICHQSFMLQVENLVCWSYVNCLHLYYGQWRAATRQLLAIAPPKIILYPIFTRLFIDFNRKTNIEITFIRLVLFAAWMNAAIIEYFHKAENRFFIMLSNWSLLPHLYLGCWPATEWSMSAL